MNGLIDWIQHVYYWWTHDDKDYAILLIERKVEEIGADMVSAVLEWTLRHAFFGKWDAWLHVVTSILRD